MLSETSRRCGPLRHIGTGGCQNIEQIWAVMEREMQIHFSLAGKDTRPRYEQIAMQFAKVAIRRLSGTAQSCGPLRHIDTGGCQIIEDSRF